MQMQVNFNNLAVITHLVGVDEVLLGVQGGIVCSEAGSSNTALAEACYARGVC